MLTTERLVLRPWEESDAAELFELARDPEVDPSAGWPPHRSAEESRRVIRDVLSTPENYAVVRKSDRRLVGCIGLKFGEDACSEKQDEPELGYWIGKAYWGNGYAPEAGRRLIAHAFSDLSCAAVWCCRYEGNEKSGRVQEKLGFTHVRTDPEGETRLGYTLPEEENVLRRENWKGAVRT